MAACAVGANFNLLEAKRPYLGISTVPDYDRTHDQYLGKLTCKSAKKRSKPYTTKEID